MSVLVMHEFCDSNSPTLNCTRNIVDKFYLFVRKKSSWVYELEWLWFKLGVTSYSKWSEWWN